MYGIYANIWGILMVNVSIYSIQDSYGFLIIYDRGMNATNLRCMGQLFPQTPVFRAQVARWSKHWPHPEIACI